MLQMSAIGHLGNEAVTRDVNGKKVISFSVAHSEKFKNGEGVLTERTTWIDCSYWNESIGILPYLKKGVQVYVQGNPVIDTYVSKEGVTRAALRVRVQSVQLLGSPRQEGGQPTSHASNNVTASNEVPETVDDLPF